MIIFIAIIAGLFIYLNFQSNQKEKERRWQREYEEGLIKSGKYERCSDGNIRTISEAAEWKKKHHQDYHYLKNKNLYSDYELNNMSLEKIIQICKPLHEEEAAKKRQAALEYERKQRYLKDPMNHYLFIVTNTNGQKPGVYMIRNRYSGKFYIGSSQNIHNRKLNHLSNLRKGKHHAYKMQKEFEEYGEGAFEFYALKVIDFEQENKPPAFMNKASNYDGVTTKKKRSTLERYEQQLIDRFNPEYNVYSDVSQWKKDNYGQRSYY